MALCTHNQTDTSVPGPIGTVVNDTASDAYIYRLWDYQSLLAHRARQSAGTERLFLLEQAVEVKKNIARYCGKNPQDLEELKKLMNKDR